MSILSTIEIGQYVFNKVAPVLRYRLSGDVYPEDCRPFDSTEEDATIVVTSATAGQIQSGRVRINIYTNDINNGSGRYVPNIARLSEIAKWGEEMVDILSFDISDYTFDIAQAPQMVADEEIQQHFVSIVLDFRRITFNK